MAQISDFAGRAQCGCVYHAEEGIPCEHDLRMLSYDELMDYVCALLDECNTPAPRRLIRPSEAEEKFVDEISRLVRECRMSLEDARSYWTKGPH